MKHKPKYSTKIGEMITWMGQKLPDGRLVGDSMADYLSRHDGENHPTVISLRRAMKAYRKHYGIIS